MLLEYVLLGSKRCPIHHASDRCKNLCLMWPRQEAANAAGSSHSLGSPASPSACSFNLLGLSLWALSRRTFQSICIPMTSCRFGLPSRIPMVGRTLTCALSAQQPSIDKRDTHRISYTHLHPGGWSHQHFPLKH